MGVIRAAGTLLTLLTIAAPALGQETLDRLFGRQVGSIRFEIEGREAPAALQSLVDVRVGDPLKPEAVHESIVHLVNAGRFEDVQVFASDRPSGVDVLFRLTPMHPIDRLEFAGTDLGLTKGDLDQLIRDRGLPGTLSGPVSLYSNQTLLQEGYSASVALLGARNTVLVSAFWLKNQPITATGTPLPPSLTLGNDNTQIGGTVVWTHQLTPSLNFVSSVEALRTVDNGGAGGQLLGGTTRQGAVRLGISSPVTARTTVYAGARYQTLQSDVAQDYSETAGFVGLTYTFR